MGKDASVVRVFVITVIVTVTGGSVVNVSFGIAIVEVVKVISGVVFVPSVVASVVGSVDASVVESVVESVDARVVAAVVVTIPSSCSTQLTTRLTS